MPRPDERLDPSVAAGSPAPARPDVAARDFAAIPPDELQRTAQVLGAEYGLLMGALGAAWSASLVRTSIFLAILGAAGVAFGFAAQAGDDGSMFRGLALVVLPLVLFLGVTTFLRLIQVQRDIAVYLVGLNRIRWFFQQYAPASRDYHVLPVHDDQVALARSVGTGMNTRPLRGNLAFMLAQTQGIVGVVTGVVAGAVAGLAVGLLVPQLQPLAWAAAVGGFAVTIGLLFGYWRISLGELWGSIESRNPTPPDEVGAPF